MSEQEKEYQRKRVLKSIEDALKGIVSEPKTFTVCFTFNNEDKIRDYKAVITYQERDYEN